ncbi:MAG: hypothetical protein M5U08_05645 [Burkholderiales bacterium]|nr:hypothetical protein [Burkholderiales bacterium]
MSARMDVSSFDNARRRKASGAERVTLPPPARGHASGEQSGLSDACSPRGHYCRKSLPAQRRVELHRGTAGTIAAAPDTSAAMSADDAEIAAHG